MEQLISAVPSPVANDIIGMGTWRLAGMADPAIQLLVTRFEGSWRELLRDDLNLYPPSQWKSKVWRSVDVWLSVAVWAAMQGCGQHLHPRALVCAVCCYDSTVKHTEC